MDPVGQVLAFRIIHLFYSQMPPIKITCLSTLTYASHSQYYRHSQVCLFTRGTKRCTENIGTHLFLFFSVYFILFFTKCRVFRGKVKINFMGYTMVHLKSIQPCDVLCCPREQFGQLFSQVLTFVEGR